MHRAALRSCLFMLTALAAWPLMMAGCPGTTGTGGPSGTGNLAFNLAPTPIIVVDTVRGIAPLTVTFDSGSSSDDGLIVARAWDFGDGGTSEEIAPSHTYTTTGEFEVTLTLTDDVGTQASETETISVTQGPVAVISVDSLAAESAPATLQFDATDSYDPDGEIASYSWDFGDGSRETEAEISHTYVSSGTFRVQLTVTDNTGVTGTDEALISIGIRTPTIEVRVPPATVDNIVCSVEAPVWLQAVYDVEDGISHFASGGIDRDRDQCDALASVLSFPGAEEIDQLIGHEEELTDLAYSPDGSDIITASEDGTLRRYSATTGAFEAEYVGTAEITCVAYSPDGTLLVYGQADGDVVLIQAATGNLVRTFSSHTEAVTDVAYSPDNNNAQILSSSTDRRAILWNVADGTILRDSAHLLDVNAVAFSLGEPMLVATGSADGLIRIWNNTSGDELIQLDGHEAAVNDLAFTSDGLVLVSGSDDGTARAWQPFLGAQIGIYDSAHEGPVSAVAVTGDGSRIITGDEAGTIRVFNSSNSAIEQSVKPCSSRITEIELAPDEETFAASIASANDILLDTDPSNGNDLNVTYPQALRMTDVASLDNADVEPGEYYIWAEIRTDQSDVGVRAYAEPTLNVIDSYTTTITANTPVLPMPDDEAAVVVPEDSSRHVMDLGPLEQGDRVLVSQLSTPGFGKFYEPEDQFGVMLVDEDSLILAWYEALLAPDYDPLALRPELDNFVLFSAASKLIVGHNSDHYYLIADGGICVNVAIQRDTGLYETRLQRVYINFDGGDAIAAGNQDPRTIADLDAADYNEFFDPSPGWGAAETATMKTVIMQTIRNTYAAYNVDPALADTADAGIAFFSSEDGVIPSLPYQTVHIGGSTPDDLLGISDYVDPRNDTATGTAIVYAAYIGELGLTGGFANPTTNPTTIGTAIGRVAAHEIGHLLGLRNTDDASDIMEGGNVRDVGDPTVARTLKTATVTTTEQVDDLTPIGIQNATLLLDETVGRP